MLESGELGQLALPHAEKGPKKEQGTSQLDFHDIHIDTLSREKKADASNNGTECASTIQSRMVPFPLAETNTCNDIVCLSGLLRVRYSCQELRKNGSPKSWGHSRKIQNVPVLLV